MAIDFSKINITREPLEVLPPVYTETAGAVLDFYGVVRGLESGAAISGLDYEVYEEMAVAKLRQIAREIGGAFALEAVELEHRVGFVPNGEPSLFLRVAAGHRAEAYEGSRALIERLKQEVPIWKNPVMSNAL